MSSQTEKSLINRVAYTLKYGHLHCIHKGLGICTDEVVATISWHSPKNRVFTCQACIEDMDWDDVEYFDDNLNR